LPRGDVIIPFGSAVSIRPDLPEGLVRIGTKHNLYTAIGVAFRF
jgi:hypothetical protein